jgi:hypothetical protein
VLFSGSVDIINLDIKGGSLGYIARARSATFEERIWSIELVLLEIRFRQVRTLKIDAQVKRLALFS